MKTIKLKDVKPGDIITYSKSEEDISVYNIVLSKNQLGVSVLRVERRSSKLDFMYYSMFCQTHKTFNVISLDRDGFKFD